MPILYKGEVVGSLYLTEKQGATEFGPNDEAVLTLFAAHAAVALANARLHAQVQHLAVEEERLRIAREMHDGLAQVLGYVSVKAGAVRRLMTLNRQEAAAKELEALESAAREVYADVREGILALRTVTQNGPGFQASIQEYVERFSQQAQVAVELSLECPNDRLGPAMEVQLSRVIQEALSNVRKHAEARKAQVRLWHENDLVFLTIEDDGHGFDPAHLSRTDGPRFGLQTMRERVESLGGTFGIESVLGQGTIIRLQVPIQ
jgi:signal transduction histidine kinase